MKRMIKFRGKSTIEGNWLYGDLDMISIPGPRIRILRGHDCYSIEVNSTTVGQFTGITDKNGKKIYEGDIVYCEWECLQSSADSILLIPGEEWEIVKFIGEVIWNQDYLQFEIKSGQLKKTPDNTMPLAYFSEAWKTDRGNDSIEVIGNIHDNPELLNTKTE